MQGSQAVTVRNPPKPPHGCSSWALLQEIVRKLVRRRSGMRVAPAFPEGPCPILSGTPPGELWAPLGTPPDALRVHGRGTDPALLDDRPARAARRGGCRWCRTAATMATGSPPRSAATPGCGPPEVAWWHLLRLGERPPPAPPDERARRYASGAISRILTELPLRPSVTELRRAAVIAGGWLEAGPSRLGEGPRGHESGQASNKARPATNPVQTCERLINED